MGDYHSDIDIMIPQYHDILKVRAFIEKRGEISQRRVADDHRCPPRFSLIVYDGTPRCNVPSHIDTPPPQTRIQHWRLWENSRDAAWVVTFTSMGAAVAMFVSLLSRELPHAPPRRGAFETGARHEDMIMGSVFINILSDICFTGLKVRNTQAFTNIWRISAEHYFDIFIFPPQNSPLDTASKSRYAEEMMQISDVRIGQLHGRAKHR